MFAPFYKFASWLAWETNTSEANKLLGQLNYNMWKFKVKNSLLREDLIDHIEKKGSQTKGKSKNNICQTKEACYHCH
jgi:hypothetical protein